MVLHPPEAPLTMQPHFFPPNRFPNSVEFGHKGLSPNHSQEISSRHPFRTRALLGFALVLNQFVPRAQLTIPTPCPSFELPCSKVPRRSSVKPLSSRYTTTRRDSSGYVSLGRIQQMLALVVNILAQL
ncbi:hypothetical protein DEO72_LG3g98 [Vigna unguiculata]|uniref:Uncharacterized protein n=1 Tax=Vigna unguiculata TaxID=3917 RepID=A0A4D6LAN5_VIGUN|nr:hypothetical protein DEO72_LG3g98 [Vigna unguiculata]